MTMPKALGAYADCEELFEQALANPRGIGITLETPGAATHLRHKLNTFRVRLRKQSQKVYPPEDPKHGTSPYDALKVTEDKENPCRVLITEHRTNVLKVESL